MSAAHTKEATPETIDEVCQEVMRCYEKRGEELIETFNRMSDQTIDLYEKTLGVYEATSARCAAPRAGSDRKLAERLAGQRSKRPEHQR